MNLSQKQKITKESFEYQWKNIPDWDFMLSNKNFKNNIDKTIVDELKLSKRWFKKKSVLDIGCGSGRWSYGFLKLGSIVTAIDFSNAACNSTKRVTQEFSKNITITKANIFKLKNKLKNKKFDLIFAWGVLHHTGDTKEAFNSLIPYLKRGAIMHVYIYGLRTSGIFVRIVQEILKIFNLKTQHKILSALSMLKGKSPHGLFDQYSPKITHRHSYEEVKEYFKTNGFRNIRRTYPSWCSYDKTDIHMNGIKL